MEFQIFVWYKFTFIILFNTNRHINYHTIIASCEQKTVYDLSCLFYLGSSLF